MQTRLVTHPSRSEKLVFAVRHTPSHPLQLPTCTSCPAPPSPLSYWARRGAGSTSWEAAEGSGTSSQKTRPSTTQDRGERKTCQLRTARWLPPPGQGGKRFSKSSTLRLSNSHTGPSGFQEAAYPLAPSYHSPTQEVLLQLQKLYEMRGEQLKEVLLQLQKPHEARRESNSSCCLLPPMSWLLSTPAWHKQPSSALPALKEAAEAGKAQAASRFLALRRGQQQEADEL